MGKRLDVSRYAAIEMVIERAMEGDERVLRIAKEKAAKGNEFAKTLLAKVEEADK